MKDPGQGEAMHLGRYMPGIIMLDMERKARKARRRRIVCSSVLTLGAAAYLTAQSWQTTGPVHGLASFMLLTW